MDRIELVVDSEVVTRSEFLEQARVLLAWQRPDWDAREPFSAQMTQQLRGYVIDAMLIAVQARRIGISEERLEEEVEAEWDLVQRRPELAGLGPLRALFRRSRRNDRYLAGRVALRKGAGEQPVTHTLGVSNPAQDEWLLELRRAARVQVVNAEGVLEPLVVPKTQN